MPLYKGNISHPFGENWEYFGKKTGGVNKPGAYGGVYKNTKTGEIALFKQDQKRRKIRVAKIIGEKVGGTILEAVMAHMNVDPPVEVAKVEWASVEGISEQPNGNNTYLKSTFIEGYQEDLWKDACRRDFKNQFIHKFIHSNPNQLNIDEAADEYANEKIKTIKKRPTCVAVTPNYGHTRQMNSNAIQKLGLIEQLASTLACRLMVGDFGVHSGNYGLANKDSTVRLVAIDFGAACCHLKSETNLYTFTKTGTKFYKNHFLEWPGIIESLEMAIAFIKAGKLPSDMLDKTIKESLSDLDKYFSDEDQRKFCQRLGMKPKQIKNQPNMKKLIEDYMINQIKQRKKDLLKEGYALLLLNCIDKNSTFGFDLNKFAKLTNEHHLEKELIEFGLSKHFRKMKQLATLSGSSLEQAKANIISSLNARQATLNKLSLKEKSASRSNTTSFFAEQAHDKEITKLKITDEILSNPSSKEKLIVEEKNIPSDSSTERSKFKNG